MRKTNFAHIPVQEKTREELAKLKSELDKFYTNVTWDELINVFLEKNKKVVLSGLEVRKIIGQRRGVII